MICPKCGEATEVEATRSTKRIRRCKLCDFRFTTREVFEEESPRRKFTRQPKAPIQSLAPAFVFNLAAGE
jgi:transcriptional regulator NrdR family protein